MPLQTDKADCLTPTSITRGQRREPMIRGLGKWNIPLVFFTTGNEASSFTLLAIPTAAPSSGCTVTWLSFSYALASSAFEEQDQHLSQSLNLLFWSPQIVINVHLRGGGESHFLHGTIVVNSHWDEGPATPWNLVHFRKNLCWNPEISFLLTIIHAPLRQVNDIHGLESSLLIWSCGALAAISLSHFFLAFSHSNCFAILSAGFGFCPAYLVHNY